MEYASAGVKIMKNLRAKCYSGCFQFALSCCIIGRLDICAMEWSDNMREELLAFIEKNAKLTANELAIFVGRSEDEVAAALKQMEAEHVICGYNTLIDWDKTDRDYVTALIEVKVTPARGQGFERVAERIYGFDEVRAVYLMSGGFDLTVIVEGKSLRDVAHFVSDRLAPLESVLSTATHFVLKKYKDHGVVLDKKPSGDDRMIVTP